MLLSGLRIADVENSYLTGGVEIYVEYTTPQTGRIAIALLEDEENAPFYMDIRYDWYKAGYWFNNDVVLTDLVNNQWQTEERPGGFPFDSGYHTNVRIVPNGAERAYKIYANGENVFNFKYRSNHYEEEYSSVMEELTLAAALDPGWSVPLEEKEATRQYLQTMAQLIASKVRNSFVCIFSGEHVVCTV